MPIWKQNQLFSGVFESTRVNTPLARNAFFRNQFGCRYNLHSLFARFVSIVRLGFGSIAKVLNHSLLWSTMLPAMGIDWVARDNEFVDKIQPILKAACLECHSGVETDAGLVLTKEELSSNSSLSKCVERIECISPQNATSPRCHQGGFKHRIKEQRKNQRRQ